MATAFATLSISNVVSLVYAYNQGVFALLLTFRRPVTFRSKRPSSCSQVPCCNVSDTSQEEKTSFSWRALRLEWEQLQDPLSQIASKISNTLSPTLSQILYTVDFALINQRSKRLRTLTVAMRLSNQEVPSFSPSISTNSLKLALASLAYYITRGYPNLLRTKHLHPCFLHKLSSSTNLDFEDSS